MSSSNSKIELLTYQEVLNQIHGKENHLLLGNGFNRGLGVDTSYSKIFQKMIERDFGLYKEAESLVQECDEDLERFIGRLTEDINPENYFLKKFVNNKVKMDFMKATQSIVKSAIKNIYSEKNSEVYLFLKNFTNYFTLNYDPFLYLLLLHYKSSKLKEKTTLVLQPSLKFIEEDLNERENNIYKEIKRARENGTLILSGVDNNIPTTPLSSLVNAHFIIEIFEYSKRYNKGWTKKDIEMVLNSLLEEEKKHQVLDKVDDGSRQLNLFDDKIEFVFDTESTTQNLFFLHGAFHIYKDGKIVKKITKKKDKALYDRIEDILNSEELELICIFQKENKKDLIEENSYLLNCLNKLNTLSGIMVIIGSSLDDNDDHIFEEIDKSNIENLYISSLDKDKENILEKATRKFPSKTIHLFDAKTISYEMPAAKNDYSNTKEEKHV